MKILVKSLMIAVMSLGSVSAYAQTSAQMTKAESSNAQQDAQKELTDLFFAAARTGNNEVIREFLKHGFPVNIKNHAGFTPLMMATYYGHQDIVTMLLNSGADRCARDNKGNTALMGAIFKLEWSIAKQLRKVDCDANAKHTGQKTTAEFAKIIGQDEKFNQMLIEQAQKQ